MNEFILERLKSSIPNIPVHLLSAKELSEKFNYDFVDSSALTEPPNLFNTFYIEEDFETSKISTNNEVLTSENILDDKDLTNDKIEDFGAKIGGARKDLYKSFKENYSSIETQSWSDWYSKSSLKDIISEPNYLQISIDYPEFSKELLAIMKLYYLQIGNKVNIRSASYLINRWVDKVKDTAALYTKIYQNLSNTSELRQIENQIRESFISNVEKDFIFTTLVDTEFYLHKKYNFTALKSFQFYTYLDHYTVINKKLRFRGNYDHIQTSVDDFLNEFKDKLIARESTKRNPKQIRFGVWSNRVGGKDYYIAVRQNQTIVKIKEGFETGSEAFDYINDKYDELADIYNDIVEIPYERNSTNNERTGSIYREGNISPEDYSETFGFRGVEFGNYLNNAERQDVLNRSYDAFMDMVSVLNLPPKAVSLNGSLNMAFGARGKGGKNAAMAHYEPAKIVINLTKNKGAGSLAHEWWHSLDNYFGKKSNLTPFASNLPLTFYGLSEDLQERTILYQKLSRFSNAVDKTKLKARSLKLDSFRSKSNPYWSTKIEMSARSFESYIKDKLKENGIENDYLVNIRSEESYAGYLDKYPYPLNAEKEDLNFYFEDFFETIKYETIDDRVHLFRVENGKLLGHFHNNEIYLNKDSLNENTAIHEYSHYWLKSLRTLNPNLYQRGINLIKESGQEYVNKITSESFYSKLSEEEVYEEALASAIGDRGANILLNNSGKSKFSGWLSSFKSFITNTFFYKQKNNLEKIDLDKFLDSSIYDLMQGEDLQLTEELEKNTKVLQEESTDDQKVIVNEFVNNYPISIEVGIYDSSKESDHRISFEKMDFVSFIEMREFLSMRSSQYTIELEKALAVRLSEGQQVFLLDDGAVVAFNDFLKETYNYNIKYFLEIKLDEIKKEFSVILTNKEEILKLVPNERHGSEFHVKITFNELRYFLDNNISFSPLGYNPNTNEWIPINKYNYLSFGETVNLDDVKYEIDLSDYSKSSIHSILYELEEFQNYLEQYNNEQQMEENVFLTEEEIQELIPLEKKGTTFHFKVTKQEAEYLIKNDIVQDIMNAEYGEDEDWVGMTKDDFIEGTDIFDDEYQTFEINLYELSKTNVEAILHEIEKYEQLPEFQIEILENVALLTNVKANTFEEAKEIAIERYNNEFQKESQFSKEPGEIVTREKSNARGVSLNIPLQSHLSDAMIEIGFNPEQAIQRLRFVKELLNTYDDLNQNITRDTLDEIWSNLYPSQKENVIAEIEFRESGETIQYTNETEFIEAIRKDVESNNRNINYNILSNNEELENTIKSIITNDMENNLPSENNNENKIELFEDISKLPLELQETILEYNEKFENGDPYELSQELLSITESYGYTFEYGLDGIPINLEPMKFFDYEYDRQTRWEEDQILLQEQEILKDLAMPSETLDFHFFRRDGKTGEQVGGTLTYRDSNFDEIKSHMTTMGDYLGADEYFEMNIHINKRNIQPLVYKHTFYDFEIDSALEEISKIVSIKSKNPQDVRIFGGKIRDIANEAVVNPTSLHKYPENIKDIINQYIYQETKDFPVDLKKVESVVFMMLDQDKGINDLIEPYSNLNSSEIKFLESKAHSLIQDEIENLNEAAQTPLQREKLAKEVNEVLTELAKLKAMDQISLFNLEKPRQYHDFELSDLTKRELQLQGSIRLADKIHQDEFFAAISLNDNETATITWASGEEQIYPFDAVFGKDWNYDLYHNNVLNNKNQNKMENSKQNQEFEVGRKASFTSEDGTFKKGKIETISDDSITIKDLNGNLATTSKENIYQFYHGQKYAIQEINELFDKYKPSGLEFKDIHKEDITRLLRGEMTNTMYDGVSKPKEGEEAKEYSFKIRPEYNSEKKEIKLEHHFKNNFELDWSRPYRGEVLTQEQVAAFQEGKSVTLERISESGKDYSAKFHYDKDLNNIIFDTFVSNIQEQMAKQPKGNKLEFKNQNEYEEFLRNDVNMFENAKKVNSFQLDKMILTLDQGELNEFLTDLGVEGKLIDSVLQKTNILTNDADVSEIKSSILGEINSAAEKVDIFKEKFQTNQDQSKGISR